MDKTIYQTLPAEFSEYRAARREHWDAVAAHQPRSWGGYYRERLTEVYRLHVPEGSDLLEVGCARGDLLAALKPRNGLGIDLSPSMVNAARSRHPALEFLVADGHDLELGHRTFDVIVLSDVINDVWDLQQLLERLRRYCRPQTRLIFNFYSRLWQPVLTTARALELATPNLPQNWFTRHDLRNLLELAGFEALREWEEVVCPLPLPGLASLCNRFLSKVAPFKWLAMTSFMIARPVAPPAVRAAKVSVVVAARNEEGHIDELMARIPEMGAGTEIIFVEGNSSDDTRGAIKRAIQANPHRACKLLEQVLGKEGMLAAMRENRASQSIPEENAPAAAFSSSSRPGSPVKSSGSRRPSGEVPDAAGSTNSTSTIVPPPGISAMLQSYIHTIVKHLELPNSCIVAALIYVMRAIEGSSRFSLSLTNWQPCLLAAFVIAAKLSFDEPVWNEDFVKALRISNVQVSQISRWEADFLQLLSYNTNVTVAQYAAMCFDLQKAHEQLHQKPCHFFTYLMSLSAPQ
jgi:SAM-dependent methyltransferase